MKKLSATLILFLFFALPVVTAQPPPPPGSNNPAPLGFVELLLGAGAAYGAKKVYDKKKKQA